ncbi:MAG: response regulator [Candidatus Saganbacteria bacterium]|nr:response regulator [Candidatus Saganbacteria bacterium]
MSNESIRKKLKEYRLKKGLTQTGLAAKLGVRDNSIALIERGERNVGKKILLKFAQLSGMSLNEITGIKSVPADKQYLKKIPIFGDSIPAEFPDNIPEEDVNWFGCPANINADFACRVRGGKRPDKEKPRILVVDDEEIARKSIKHVLEKSFNVDLAASGEEALERIKQHTYDLVLLDIKMPGISGIEVLRKMRQLVPRTEVIMLTALDKAKTSWEASQNGAFDYITKPFRNDELLLRVQMAITRMQEMSEKELPDDAVLLCQQTKSAQDGDLVIARSIEGEHYAVRMLKKSDNKDVLFPINEKDALKKVNILGKVIAVLNKIT